MSGSWHKKRVAVERLAAQAAFAADRERAYRAGLAERGKRLVTSGKIVVLVGLAGLLLPALFSRRHDDDAADERDERRKHRKHRKRDRGDDSDSPGLLSRAGMLLLAAFRWRGIASEAAQLLKPLPAVEEPRAPTNKA